MQTVWVTVLFLHLCVLYFNPATDFSLALWGGKSGFQ